MRVGRTFPVAAVVLFAGTAAAAGPNDPDPARQKAAQQKVQGKVADAARRTASTLDAMAYQRLSPTGEQKMLDEVADGLKGLTLEEIEKVLGHLDAAAAAPDPATADREQLKAYEEHRRVVSRLRGLLVKLDVVKNLDEAAARLDRAADDQLTVNGETLGAAARRAGRNRGLAEAKDDLADKQGALGNEVGSVLKQIEAMLPSLNAEQKARAEKADLKARGEKLAADLPATTRTVGRGEFDDAAERQRRHAKELKDLAAALRAPPGDQLAALKAARAKVDAAAKAQEQVNKDTAGKPDQPEDEDRPGRRERPEAKVAKGQELANAQTKAEFATRDARKTTEPVAPEVADGLKPAETQQWRAEDKLRAGDLNTAKEPQVKALDALKAARDELDKRIAAAEQAKNDPLAAVKQAGEQIDKLIADQKDAAAKTDEAAEDDAKLKDAAKAQQDVGKKTEALRDAPLPPNDGVKDALAKAAEAMKQADKDLAAKNPEAAKPDQQDAVKALEDAKKALDQQAAAIEKRRDDIAKLEEAKKKLDDLAKAEKNVADDAKKAAADAKPDPKDPAKELKQPDTKGLADKQGDLQKPTDDVAKDLKDAAPEAAQKAAEAGKQQEGAKQDLAKNDPMKGAEKAADAAQKLAEAGKEVDQKLAEKRGQEANDQQALQPDAADPNNTQQQLAKAAEQAMKAADKANEAAKALNQKPDGQPQKPMPGQPTLNEMQRQVAKESDAAQQGEAAKAAGEAAQALDKNDLPAAVDQQQKALDALKEAAKNQPADAKPMAGQKAPGQLAQDQQKLLDATKALQQSQQATEAAKAALAQAQANAPMAVQPQLDQAGEALKQAGDQLGQGQPGQAGQNQEQAADALGQAMEALKAAGMGQGQPGEPGMGEPMPGQGQKPGQPGQGKEPGKGQQPGQKPGDQPGPGEPQNEGVSQGDQNGPEKLKNAASSGTMKGGDGGFIHLRKKERDSVRQAGGDQFPAEFRELIKQYNINIKKTDPAPATTSPARPPGPPAGGKK
ncbi:MAG: hypothetical protein K2X82_09190 [Gemmataceae bacterium]|nr:hypothetical protein [Gemmataceae bacterium]